jgi:YHS domain-containing protein/thiol-disulfide isomerase/thioredoxin
MSFHFKVPSIVGCATFMPFNPPKQLTTAAVFTLFLLPVIPTQAQQIVPPHAPPAMNRTVEQIQWLNNLEHAQALATQTNRPIFIHFVQDGCPACEFAATQTFQNQQLIKTIHARFIPVKINISQSDGLRQRFKIKQTPTDIILDTNQEVFYRGLTNFDPQRYVGILDTLEIAVIDDLVISTGIEFDPSSTMDLARDSAHVNEHFVTTASYPEQFQQQAYSPGAPQISSNTIAARPTKTPLGLDGYCCVSLANLDGTGAAWINGNPHIGIKHRDRLYLFSNRQNLQLFLSNPDKFSPVLSGFDPVLFTDHQRLIDGQRRFGVAYQKRIYLFQNEYTLRTFWNAPDKYAKAALDAMNRTR